MISLSELLSKIKIKSPKKSSSPKLKSKSSPKKSSPKKSSPKLKSKSSSSTFFKSISSSASSKQKLNNIFTGMDEENVSIIINSFNSLRDNGIIIAKNPTKPLLLSGVVKIDNMNYIVVKNPKYTTKQMTTINKLYINNDIIKAPSGVYTWIILFNNLTGKFIYLMAQSHNILEIQSKHQSILNNYFWKTSIKKGSENNILIIAAGEMFLDEKNIEFNFLSGAYMRNQFEFLQEKLHSEIYNNFILCLSNFFKKMLKSFGFTFIKFQQESKTLVVDIPSIEYLKRLDNLGGIQVYITSDRYDANLIDRGILSYRHEQIINDIQLFESKLKRLKKYTDEDNDDEINDIEKNIKKLKKDQQLIEKQNKVNFKSSTRISNY